MDAVVPVGERWSACDGHAGIEWTHRRLLHVRYSGDARVRRLIEQLRCSGRAVQLRALVKPDCRNLDVYVPDIVGKNVECRLPNRLREHDITLEPDVSPAKFPQHEIK